jgi:hypothetical protein
VQFETFSALGRSVGFYMRRVNAITAGNSIPVNSSQRPDPSVMFLLHRIKTRMRREVDAEARMVPLRIRSGRTLVFRAAIGTARAEQRQGLPAA